MSIITILSGIFAGRNYVRSAVPLTAPAAVVSGRRAVRVPRNTRPLYEERGWRRRGAHSTGTFRTKRGSTQGVIKKPDGPEPDFFVIDPRPRS